MAQTEYRGAGSITKLRDIVAELAPAKVFLVTGKTSYAASGAAPQVDAALQGTQVLHYTDFGALPLDEDIQKGLATYAGFAPDLVVAVGGGHVIDVAKAINHFGGQKPLAAIPTTAGSGSEATRFAVVYKGGQKTSLEDPAIVPTYAIVDSTLMLSAPRQVLVAAALDALCQAVESLWAKGATDESRGYARQALELLLPNIAAAVDGDAKAMEALSAAAHLSGKAIDISKTTACHAFSYGLTFRFGVPHGIAAAIFLPSMMRFNAVALPGVTPELVEELLQGFGITNLSQFGVSAADVPSLAAAVNAERLGNNPRAVSQAQVADFYTQLL